jgi:periplasmic protein CpxP/Spy
MSSLTHPVARSAPFARSVAIAALMGAAMIAIPPATARADTAAGAAIQLAQAAAPQTPAAKGATKPKGETVEQRIAKLHKALKITPDEEPKWSAVAQAMRDNAANMEKLVAAKRTTPPQNMTAVDDLKMYQEFAQAHVDGLNNLAVSFEALYVSMPDAQKKLADEVFRASAARRRAARAHHQ